MMRSRAMLGGGAIILAAGTIAFTGATWFTPTPPAAAPTAVPAATTEVVRGTLLDTKTVTGTLGYGDLSSLRPDLTEASAMVTWIAPVGSTVLRGEPLYALGGQPTVLFYGSVPQHRTLRFEPDAEFPVWVELEQAEVALEAAELTLRLEQARLADAEARTLEVGARLEDALAKTPAMPEFIQLAGAISAAEAKVARVRELSAAELAPSIDIASAMAELASARATFDVAIRALRKDISVARLDAVTARATIAAAETKRDAMHGTLDALVARAPDTADIAQLADNLTTLGYDGTLGEQVRAWQRAAGFPVTGIVGPSHLMIAEGSVHIAAHGASVGETLVASSSDRGSILDYSSTEKLAVVPLAVGDQALAAVGRAVVLTLPDDSEVEGAISEVGSIVTNGAIDVVIAIADQAALGGLEIAAVDVAFVNDSRDAVLSVPVAALLARPEGGFAVEAVIAGASALVPVDTGLFAAGRVEVTGEGIAEGMLVGVPR